MVKYLDYEGLKYLWKKIEKMVDNVSSTVTETLYITISSNQSTKLFPKVFIEYVDAAGSEKNFVYQYEEGMYIQIPQNVQYKVSLEDVDGYKTPDTKTFTSVAGGSRNETFTYNAELVNVTITSNFSDFSKVSQITINGAQVSIINGKASTLIPYGSDYEIIPESVEMYITPKSQSFIASQSSREVTFNYIGSKLKISSSSNQGDIKLSATVTSGDYNIQITDNEYHLIPTGSDVNIVWSDIEGYKTPNSITRTFDGGSFEINGEYLAEKVEVTINSNMEDFPGTYSININNKDIDVIDGKAAVLVPYGVNYSIIPKSIENYTSTGTQTFTASQTIREVSVEYTGSKLKLTSTSNQGGIDLNATIQYNNKTINITNTEYVIVPTGANVTITWSDIEGYKTPEQIIRTFDGGYFDLNGRYLAEKVIVNFSSSDGNASIYTVTINGKRLSVSNNTVTTLVPHGVTYSIVPEDVNGYITPDPQIFTAELINRTVNVSYSGAKLMVTASSNQSGEEIPVNAIISFDGQTITVTEEKYIIIPANKDITITWNDIDDYKTPATITKSFTSGEHVLNGEYKTEVVTITVTSSDNSNIVGKQITINDKKYILDTNKQVICRIAHGIYYSVVLDDYKYYIKSDSVSYTANSVSRTINMSYTRSTLSLSTYSNQGENISVNAVVSWSGGSCTVIDNNMIEIPINIPVTIDWGEVSNYRTPASITKTFTGGDNELIGEYYQEKVTIQLSAVDNGDVSNTRIYINGSAYFTNTNGVVVAYIPYDTKYTISVEDKDNYATPDPVTYTAGQKTRSISMQYTTASLVIKALSNQYGENLPVSATITYNGKTISVSNSNPITIPIGATITVKFNSIAGYSTPSQVIDIYGAGTHEVIGKYYTEVVTVTVSADNGDSTSGRTVTINGSDYILNSNGQTTVKIPYGTSYSVSVGKWSGYITPSSKSYTANSETRSVALSYIRNTLRVFSYSNQGGSLNTTATVKYGSTTTQVTSSNTYIDVPLNTTITITFGSKSDYKKPDTITTSFSSGGDHIVEGTYYTEKVTVTVKDGNGNILPNIQVSIDGYTYETNSSGKATAYVPHDTYYAVYGESMDGYSDPETQQFTASRTSRSVTLIYELILFGVLCMDTNGNYYTASSWPSTASPLGVAVITDECEFLVGPEDLKTTEYGCVWGDETMIVDGCNIFSYSEYGGQYEAADAAKTDFDGYSNTSAIVSEDDVAEAAPQCWRYSYGGKSDWYLGAAGEMQIVADNIDKINECLSVMGCDELYTSSNSGSGKNNYWSSTQMSKVEAWYSQMPGGIFRWQQKSWDWSVRPLGRL